MHCCIKLRLYLTHDTLFLYVFGQFEYSDWPGHRLYLALEKPGTFCCPSFQLLATHLCSWQAASWKWLMYFVQL